MFHAMESLLADRSFKPIKSDESVPKIQTMTIKWSLSEFWEH